MKNLDTFAFDSVSNARGTYDWATLLDGKIWQVEAGVDYKVRTNNFLIQAKGAAKRRGGVVKYARVPTGLVLQFFASVAPMDEAAPTNEEQQAATDYEMNAAMGHDGSSLDLKSMNLVSSIRQWANLNYEKGGSFIIETMTDAEIVEQFKTLKAAKDYAKAMRSRELDVQNA